MTRRKILRLLAVALLLALQLALNAHAARLARQNPPLDLTLAAPVSADTLAAARAWEQSDANANGISASLWGSKKAAAATELGRTAAAVTCIFFAGNAGDCLPADYLQGAAPGAQGQQCAVSSALAWALFGSNDIVGQTLTLDRTQYTICDVFDADTQIMLYPGRSGFTHAALRGTSPDTPKADAEQWAAAAGVGEISAIDYGPQRVWLAGALRFLPAALVGVGMLVILLRFIAALPGLARGLCYFALALLFALALPRFLQALPGWLIPSRWSNFAFWPELWRKIRENAPTP